MSQNPTTPPEISSTEDTPPESLLARLRKITGVTDPAPPPDKAHLKMENGAPPVDRLIVELRDGFAALTAVAIAVAVVVAVGAIRLWSHGKAGANRARLWLREVSVRKAAARTKRAERVIQPALEPVTTHEPREEMMVVEPPPGPAVEPEHLSENVPDEPVVPQAAPPGVRPARRFRPAVISTAAVLLTLPALWLVKPVRYYFTSLMGRGNAAVIVGSDGWLFPRAESEAAAAPPPVRGIAAALRAQGAALVIVSVPAKSAVYPEKLTGSGGGELKRQPQIAAVLKELTDAGAQVLDLGPVLHGMKAADATEGFVFSLQSTEWSPRGMAQAAFAAASFIQAQPGYAALPLQPSLAVMTPATGAATTDDLVTALDSPRMQSRYPAESVPLIRLLTAAKKEPLASEAASPVALLGGACVSLYDDPALGHPAEGVSAGQRSSAGFAQHLAWHLSMSLEVHTAGSSLEAARDWLASRPEADRKTKRLIVWVLPDADLLH